MNNDSKGVLSARRFEPADLSRDNLNREIGRNDKTRVSSPLGGAGFALFRHVKDRHYLLHYVPLLKKTCVSLHIHMYIYIYIMCIYIYIYTYISL